MELVYLLLIACWAALMIITIADRVINGAPEQNVKVVTTETGQVVKRVGTLGFMFCMTVGFAGLLVFVKLWNWYVNGASLL